MDLNPQTVEAYRQILANPAQHGFTFKPIQDYFEPSDTVIAKHILYDDLIAQIKVPLPKVIFYILMDRMYGNTIGKAENGCAGYALKIIQHTTLAADSRP